MKFSNNEELRAWQETNRTHEECCDCPFIYIMPSPCKEGHAHGENACRLRPKFIDAINEINATHI